MSSQQETFRASVQNAEQTKLNTLASAVTTHQVTIDAAFQSPVIPCRAEIMPIWPQR